MSEDLLIGLFCGFALVVSTASLVVSVLTLRISRANLAYEQSAAEREEP